MVDGHQTFTPYPHLWCFTRHSCLRRTSASARASGSLTKSWRALRCQGLNFVEFPYQELVESLDLHATLSMFSLSRFIASLYHLPAVAKYHKPFVAECDKSSTRTTRCHEHSFSSSCTEFFQRRCKVLRLQRLLWLRKKISKKKPWEDSETRRGLDVSCFILPLASSYETRPSTGWSCKVSAKISRRSASPVLLNCSIDIESIQMIPNVSMRFPMRSSWKRWMHCFAPVLKVPRYGDVFFFFFPNADCHYLAMPIAAQAKLEASGDMDLNEFSAPQVEWFVFWLFVGCFWLIFLVQSWIRDLSRLTCMKTTFEDVFIPSWTWIRISDSEESEHDLFRVQEEAEAHTKWSSC